MEHDTANHLIHLYDTEQHRIVCGVRQQTGSTKHVGGVTCPDCLGTRSDRERTERDTHAEPAAP
jgi:hypothetical protein